MSYEINGSWKAGWACSGQVKLANMLNKLPKAVQPKVKEALYDIWMEETHENTCKAFDAALTSFSEECLARYDKNQ